MPDSIDAFVILATHPTHRLAVTAELNGSQAHIARAALQAAGWTAITDTLLVLARIDHEEPYWAKQAAKRLTAEGITVEITPRLSAAMDQERTWAHHLDRGLTSGEIRARSDRAQKIHDDILHGELVIHAHAHDGHDMAAVGTYRTTRKRRSVHLRGENHLRRVTAHFASPAQAMRAFEETHAHRMHPGPAPLTYIEREAAQARSNLALPEPDKTTPPLPEPEAVPVYAADPGNHDALLDDFLDAHDTWHKWRPRDESTYAVHESQTLRIERVHEPLPGEHSWTVAGYESPVSDRMWHLAFPDTTPEPVVRTLLDSLSSGDHNLALGSPITAKTVAQAVEPLTQAGWENTIDGRCIRWASPHGGVQLDTFAAQNPYLNPTWLIWAGPNPQHATWVVHASAYTPAQVLTELVECLAPEAEREIDVPTTMRAANRTQPSVTLPAAPTAIKAPPGPSR
ncbi:DUF317 domain-containing protein [Streptomyces sp. NPDC052299]|uniref:DUF317 domain-containing protein n=1 Tax=Streptomyces sp. NPDC052299 TaxID=3155054 RepID=UPI003416DB16